MVADGHLKKMENFWWQLKTLKRIRRTNTGLSLMVTVSLWKVNCPARSTVLAASDPPLREVQLPHPLSSLRPNQPQAQRLHPPSFPHWHQPQVPHLTRPKVLFPNRHQARLLSQPSLLHQPQPLDQHPPPAKHRLHPHQRLCHQQCPQLKNALDSVLRVTLRLNSTTLEHSKLARRGDVNSSRSTPTQNSTPPHLLGKDLNGSWNPKTS